MRGREGKQNPRERKMTTPAKYLLSAVLVLTAPVWFVCAVLFVATSVVTSLVALCFLKLTGGAETTDR
jgi:hypothetical protein